MSSSSITETDFLIVGAGPAGASLACFLVRYGIKGIMIAAAPGTADTPRAHVTNLPALECLRDIGLWEECEKLGHHGAAIAHFRWCESMAGEEYARVESWGNLPERKGDFERASPCRYLDLPQTLLEPILIKYATNNGFKARFDTELLSFSRDDMSGKYVCLVQDVISGLQYSILTKYLFGADGGRSTVAKQLELPFTSQRSGGLCFNVLVKADLEHLTQYRQALLHWTLRLQRDFPLSARPNPERSTEEWRDIVSDFIDDHRVSPEILGVSRWFINETSANMISKGNVFCLGDAIHRHPPAKGLGSNTCIQDAFNLAWKLDLVHRGLASPSLLETYNAERQPIAAKLVQRANEGLRDHLKIWHTLGMLPEGHSLPERLNGITELRSSTHAGKERRRMLKESLLHIHNETHGLGLAMGQRYVSDAVYDADEMQPWEAPGKESENADMYYEPCTYPGRRLPHVWLDKAMPTKMVSTLDLAGKGNFCLFTGIGGDAWRSAAITTSHLLGIKITVVSIGPGLDWEDKYFQWEMKRGVDEDGAVLVRPDLFVAWRAGRVAGNVEACTAKLERVCKALLSLE